MTLTAHRVRGESLRVPPDRARRALQPILGSSVTAAVARLRHGPNACEPLARLIDGAHSPDDGDVVIAAASVGAGIDVVRVRRKAHGKADWISSPTCDVVIVLGPSLVEPEISELPVRAPEVPVTGIWERELPAPEAAVLARLYDVLDPDLGINIVDFGFVRDIAVSDDHVAAITMTLTSPTCPVTGVMTDQLRAALLGEDPIVSDFRIEWSWTPAWRPHDLSSDGVEQLRAVGFNPVEAR
ncbi:iron-sulfur cluster assembly protein [Nocardia miyunensis]|uniref:iron-sulfur cluster assembly protein n=1 Tax=Nocardia miyunensis TaxID=282684 RepID=UPI0009FCA2BA|nr:iron-sulfur cluster assembly protein [Nocardia miyunensis]